MHKKDCKLIGKIIAEFKENIMFDEHCLENFKRFCFYLDKFVDKLCNNLLHDKKRFDIDKFKKYIDKEVENAIQHRMR